MSQGMQYELLATLGDENIVVENVVVEQ